MTGDALKITVQRGSSPTQNLHSVHQKTTVEGRDARTVRPVGCIANTAALVSPISAFEPQVFQQGVAQSVSIERRRWMIELLHFLALGVLLLLRSLRQGF